MDPGVCWDYPQLCGVPVASEDATVVFLRRSQIGLGMKGFEGISNQTVLSGVI